MSALAKKIEARAGVVRPDLSADKSRRRAAVIDQKSLAATSVPSGSVVNGVMIPTLQRRNRRSRARGGKR